MGVGSAAMIHFAMATHAISDDFPCDIIGPLFYQDDILQVPLSLDAGCAVSLDRPGLGVDLDEGKIEKYRVR